MLFFIEKAVFLGIKHPTSVWVLTQKTLFFAQFYFKFAIFCVFSAFEHKKCWKCLFWPAFGVPSNPTLVNIYNNYLYWGWTQEKFWQPWKMQFWNFAVLISVFKKLLNFSCQVFNMGQPHTYLMYQAFLTHMVILLHITVVGIPETKTLFVGQVLNSRPPGVHFIKHFWHLNANIYYRFL